MYIEIITRYLRNVNIRRQLQNRSGVLKRNVFYYGVVNRLKGIWFQLLRGFRGILWLKKKRIRKLNQLC